MNWLSIGGVLLHLLKNAPAMVDMIEQLFDAARSQQRAPTPVWQLVTNAIEQTRRANRVTPTDDGRGDKPA